MTFFIRQPVKQRSGGSAQWRCSDGSPKRCAVSPAASNWMSTAGSRPTNPGIVTRLQHDNLRGGELERAAVSVLAPHMPRAQEAHVPVHGPLHHHHQARLLEG